MSKVSNRASPDATVIPIDDEPFRFFVPSFATPWVEYVCDLTHFDFNGSCTCDHFMFGMEPRLRKGERGRHLTCKHVRAAKEAAWQFIGPMIAAQLKKDREAKHGPAVPENAQKTNRIYHLRRP